MSVVSEKKGVKAKKKVMAMWMPENNDAVGLN